MTIFYTFEVLYKILKIAHTKLKQYILFRDNNLQKWSCSQKTYSFSIWYINGHNVHIFITFANTYIIHSLLMSLFNHYPQMMYNCIPTLTARYYMYISIPFLSLSIYPGQRPLTTPMTVSSSIQFPCRVRDWPSFAQSHRYLVIMLKSSSHCSSRVRSVLYSPCHTLGAFPCHRVYIYIQICFPPYQCHLLLGHCTPVIRCIFRSSLL